MVCNCKFIALNSEFEEEAVLLVEGCLLYCFINSCPFYIIEGGGYNVELSLTFLEDFIPIEVDSNYDTMLEQIDGSFRYKVIGVIEKGKVTVGNIVFIEDEFLNYSYLLGKKIQFIADRISVNFIS